MSQVVDLEDLHPKTELIDEEARSSTLKASVHDGIAYSVMVGAGESYLGAFGIALGALPIQVGILATLPPLVGSIFQLIGVGLLELLKKRRELLVFFSSLQSALWLPIILLPFVLTQGTNTVSYLIGIVCIYYLVAGFLAPIWSSLIGDVVPVTGRGAFFGKRSKWCGLASFLAILVAGQTLDIFKSKGEPFVGFLVIFLFALFARAYSAFCFSRHVDPPFKVEAGDRFTLLDFLRRSPKSNFARFTIFVGLLNFAVNLAGPYFLLYLLRELSLSYGAYTLVIAAAVVSQYLTLQNWGEISDRFGNRRIMSVCAAGAAIVPLLWLFSSVTWYLILIQIFSGAVWAGFNLAVANFLFDAVTPGKRARCVAYQSLINGICVFIGSVLGAYLLDGLKFVFVADPKIAFLTLFGISALLRAGVAILFLPMFREVREVDPISGTQLIFRITHLRPISGATFNWISTLKSKKGNQSRSSPATRSISESK